MANENRREYKTLVTSVGKTKIAAAILGGDAVNIVWAAVGDGGGAHYMPTAAMTELRREVWRGGIAGKRINQQSAGMVDVKLLLPADVGGFTVREAGLLDADGDLIAVCNVPDTEKTSASDGTAGTLTVIMHIALTDADSVVFHIDPKLDVMTAEDVDAAVRTAIKKVLLEQAKKPSIVISDTEPESGPVLWFDTSIHHRQKNNILLLELGGEEHEALTAVTAEISGEGYPVLNAEVSGAQTENTYYLDIQN